MTDRQITHAPVCWGWGWDWGLGPKHYECVVAEIERDEAMLRQAMQALEKARDALYEGHPVRVNMQGAIAALRERLGEGEQQ